MGEFEDHTYYCTSTCHQCTPSETSSSTTPTGSTVVLLPTTGLDHPNHSKIQDV